jgi:hypothetical protein
MALKRTSGRKGLDTGEKQVRSEAEDEPRDTVAFERDVRRGSRARLRRRLHPVHSPELLKNLCGASDEDPGAPYSRAFIMRVRLNPRGTRG